MKIKVTQAHIDEAWSYKSTCYSGNCPVALALNDAGFPRAQVYSPRQWPEINLAGRATVRQPAEVISFVNQFDEDRFQRGTAPASSSAQPFEFDLLVEP